MITPIINWPSYWLASGITAAIYYAIVGLRYYRKAVFGKVSAGQPKQPASQTNLFSSTIQKTNEPSSSVVLASDLQSEVHELVYEMNALLLQSSAEKAGRETLTEALRRLLQKYAGLYGTPYQQEILNLIAVDAENKCNIHFTADELATLW
jgi:hypothetical protein